MAIQGDWIELRVLLLRAATCGLPRRVLEGMFRPDLQGFRPDPLPEADTAFLESALAGAYMLLSVDGGFYVTAAQAADLGGPWHRARWAPVLLLDDLGGEHIGESGWAASQIGRLLLERINDGLRTLLVARPSLSAHRALEKRYGEAVAVALDCAARPPEGEEED